MSLPVKVIFKDVNGDSLFEGMPGNGTLFNRTLARGMVLIATYDADESIVENFASATVCNPYDGDFGPGLEYSFTREEILHEFSLHVKKDNSPGC